jgi:hypothetical protein
MRSSSRRGTGATSRMVAGQPAALAGLALAVALALLLPAAQARADTERIRLILGFARSVSRFHSFEADSMGLSYELSNSPEADIDFRVLDLPMPKTPRPALHVTAGALTDQRTLGPFLPGQPLTQEPVIVLRSGVYLLVPLELVRPNAGVALRVGWSGAYVLRRTGGEEFITITKARFGFERTTGWFEGSCVEVGMGRDETFGREFAGKRWDAHVALQGRILPPPRLPAPAKTAKTAAPPDEPRRMVWAFVDMVVDTDGGPGPDGLRLRFGLSTDVAGILQTAFNQPTVNAPAH